MYELIGGAEQSEIEFPDFTKLSVGVEFKTLNPELLSLLTGGVLGGEGTEPTGTLVAVYKIPVRRSIWQWLLRRPRQYTTHHMYIPRAKFKS